jgi:FkbM family methyltransferase
MTQSIDRYHSLIRNFPAWSGYCPEGCSPNFLGSITRKCFFDDSLPLDFTLLSERNTFFESPTPPPINEEEYFEYIAFLMAVKTASDRFVMMELGAGYGRWLVNAAMAMRATKNIPVRLIGVEAEPTHFAMLNQHFTDNNLTPDDHKLIQAAIATEAGSCFFTIGHAVNWYGQSIVANNGIDTIDNYFKTNYPGSKIIEMPAITLMSLLESEKQVDLIDADIQGAEFDVMLVAQEQLNAKVKYVFIGTHGTRQEYGLRELFTRNGWFNVYDFPCNSEFPTQPGEITSFQDGVQFWINPRLVSEIPDGARVYYTSKQMLLLDYEELTHKCENLKPLINERDSLIEKLKNPSYTAVIEQLRKHRIVWLFISAAYRVFAKLYRMMRAIKRKLCSNGS